MTESDSDYKAEKGKARENEESDGGEVSSSESGELQIHTTKLGSHMILNQPFLVIPPIVVETDLMTGYLYDRNPNITTTWDVRDYILLHCSSSVDMFLHDRLIPTVTILI